MYTHQELYNHFFLGRIGGSLIRCDWLAISIKGRSHIVRIRSGVERGSEKREDNYERVVTKAMGTVIFIKEHQ